MSELILDTSTETEATCPLCGYGCIKPNGVPECLVCNILFGESDECANISA